ncbi:MAG TPA: nitroreductase family protein [Acidimicrobiia bacterium]|jgi:nitroreductase
METWDAITSRRNVREFSDQPLRPEDLDRILEAGRLTPSARNWQPWDFIAVTDPDLLKELTGVWRGAWHVAGAKAAIAVISLTGEQELPILNLDLGQAVMQMMIAAADLGIGTGHASVHDQDLARKILGFPADRYCAHLISVGYPADRPLRPIKAMNRKPFDEVVHRDRW